MKIPVIISIILILSSVGTAQPVMRNPGLPENEVFDIHERIDPEIGFATTKVKIFLRQQNNARFYTIEVNEGNFFQNIIEVNYNDLTTISETRADLRTNKIIQYYKRSGDTIQFFNSEKKVNKIYISDETNIYSPLAYFYSFRGYPFESGKPVSFKTYMYEYGGVLTMNLILSGEKTVTVKAGTFNCYVLQLSVGGWQSLFAPDKYYLYFTVANPHIFVKYEEIADDKWSFDELIRYEK